MQAGKGVGEKFYRLDWDSAEKYKGEELKKTDSEKDSSNGSQPSARRWTKTGYSKARVTSIEDAPHNGGILN